MFFKPEVLCCKGSHVDDTEHISFTRLHSNCKILSIIHERSVWDGFSACRVGVADEEVEKSGHLVMVPVGKRKHNLFIVLVLVGRIRIVYDQWATQTIRILTLDMGMIPICTRLVNL